MSTLSPFLTFLSAQGFSTEEIQTLQTVGATSPYGVLEVDAKELAEDLKWTKYRAADLKGFARSFIDGQKASLQPQSEPVLTPVGSLGSSTNALAALASAVKTAIVGEPTIQEMKLVDLLRLAATPPDPDDREAVINRLQAIANQQLAPEYHFAGLIAVKDGKVSVEWTLAFWAEIRGSRGIKLPRTYEGADLVQIGSLWEVGKKLFSPTTGRQLIAGMDGNVNWKSVCPDNQATLIERLSFVVWARKMGELRDWRDGELVKALRKPTEDEDIRPLYAAFLAEIGANLAQRQTLEYSVYRKPEISGTVPSAEDGFVPRVEMTSTFKSASDLLADQLCVAFTPGELKSMQPNLINSIGWTEAGGKVRSIQEIAPEWVACAERHGLLNTADFWSRLGQARPLFLKEWREISAAYDRERGRR